jgi:hypothetical protein
MYNVFVGYTHAFVYRNKLIECLKKSDVPDKLLRLTALTLNVQEQEPRQIDSIRENL